MTKQDHLTNGTVDAAGSHIEVRRGVKALIRRAGQTLLIEERHADGSTFWTLPGGGCRAGETTMEALQRELREELDCRVLIDQVVTQFWYAHMNGSDALSRYTVCSCWPLTSPTPKRREGILTLRWFDTDELPPSTIPQVRFIIREGGALPEVKGDPP